MKKKFLALAACVILLIQLASPAVLAEEEIYFVATERIVLPLTEDTMPFWNKSNLYISGSIFTGLARESVGISHVISEEDNLLVLYGGGKALFFEVGKTYAQDETGATLFPGAVVKNGNIFVPASLVASHFGLKYSITGAPHGFLVWMRHEDMILTDHQFAKAATGPMNNRYESYLKEQANKDPNAGTSPGPAEPEQPGAVTGERVYLCMLANDRTEELLDALDSYGARAVFFCTAAFMETHGGLLRRMTATGHSIGILADGADPERSVEEQLEAANRALYRATFGKSRLVRLQNADAADLKAAEQKGFRCLHEDMDYSQLGLESTYAAATLLRQIVDRDQDASVWLGERASADGLRYFLDVADAAGVEQCLAWSETA